MLELLKVDFKRVLRDKLFLVVCILSGVFALTTPLLYLLIFKLAGAGDLAKLALLGVSVNGKSQFFDFFSLANNLGLIAPVLLAVALCKDFSHGTVRNKIIAGKSRSEIFLSMLTVCFAVMFGIMLAGAVLTLLVSLIFFPFQDSDFVASDVGYFLLSLLFEAVLYLFVSALVCFLCAATKNVGLVIVFYIAISMGMTFVTSILQIGELMIVSGVFKTPEAVRKIIVFLQDINVFNFAMVIGKGVEYGTLDVLCCILSPLIGGVGFTAWGIAAFNRKDLK